MNTNDMLEVTITHKLRDATEVKELYEKGWIGIDFGRKGPDFKDYSGQGARKAVALFQKMREQGAAVIAAYKGATHHPSERIVGYVEPKTEFTRPHELLCLPLTSVKRFDSSMSFLGNLPPRQCTIQPCHERAKGRLAKLVRGEQPARSVELLHHRDVELLVTNYLIMQRMCECVWIGGQSLEGIDHGGRTPDGNELLAQTTVSRTRVGKKAEDLLKLKQEGRQLHFFGPRDSSAQCPAEIKYHAIEDVFQELDVDECPAGKWLIDRMLSAVAKSTLGPQ